MDEVRGFTPEQLEDARLNLKHALDVERNLSDQERCTANRILGGTLLRLGSTFEAEERLEEALAFEEAAHGDPRSTASGREIIFMLGVVYQRTERVEDAIHSFETVMEADDSHWRSKFHLATMAVKSQMYADARELLEQVLRDEPDHQLSLQILGKLDELDACKNEEVADPE
ncbi:hypothetical protein AB1Y20_008998 [Prymnesium parvum]|uniref:Tetratricopeptide repeat protein n=1 Tax=Prymnesium parvum TaxID=97485 RepID=A0AB34K391_PRYPA